MGTITMITSGKGGVGKSTISAGIACALAERGQKVLLLDGDAGMRSLDLILGIGDKAVYDFSDIFNGNCEPYRAIYPSPVYRGVSMVAAPPSFESLCTPRDMRRLCKGFGKYYDQVIIDCPAGVGNGFKAAMEAAERALVVCTPDAVSSRDAAMVGDMLRQNKVSSRLIINRLRATPILRGKTPDIDDIIDAAGIRLIGVVPEDEMVATAAANGQPLSGNCPAVEAYRNIAARLMGNSVPLMDLEKAAP